MGTETGRRAAEAGQSTPLMLGVLALAVAVLMALVPLTRAAQQRAHARTAADAAALAGAAEGEGAAHQLAAANGAQLVAWAADGTDVWVTVTVGDAQAQAKARREVSPVGG